MERSDAPRPLVSDGAAFAVHTASEAGQLPREVAEGLARLATAVSQVRGATPPGVIGLRFGHRVIVAPARDPEAATDIVDVDVARRTVLSVGGRDPGGAGALLAQILLLRREAMVGYLEPHADVWPTLEVLEGILPRLRDAPHTRADDLATVVLGRQAEQIETGLRLLGTD